MLKPTSIHHLAMCTADMKKQIEFFTDVLGLELIALYWMHGAEGCWHGFMKVNDTCSLAFVFTPDMPNTKSVLGVSHARNGAGSSAPGTAQHIAFNVTSMEAMLNLRDRIRSKGVNVIGPIDHGFCDSMYFAGPEGINLEVAYSKDAINPKAWIDPEVVALAGISEEELARYTSPAPYTGTKKVRQPKKVDNVPHMPFDPPFYKGVLWIPDWLISKMASNNDEPVKIAKADRRKMTSNEVKPTSFHHLAFSTGNMKKQIEYFTDVLGMELIALYWMHGAEGCWHGFLKLNDTCSIAFVSTPDNATIKPIEGVTHARDGAKHCAPGAVQHVSFNVNSAEELVRMRDRIRSKGVPVFGPLGHGFCDSIYFAGPENMLLEVAYSNEAIHQDVWIDPEVVELAGISAEELERFKSPAPFVGQGGAVPQPPKDESKPHMVYDAPLGDKILEVPDEELRKMASFTEPPVKVA